MKKPLLITALLLILICIGAACSHEPDDPADTSVTTAPTTDGAATSAPSDTPSPPVEDPTETPTEEATEAPTEDLPPMAIYTVSFFVSGNVGSQPAPLLVPEGGTATPPQVNRPEDGSSFDGWYTTPTPSPESKFDFSTPITDNITLFALITPPADHPDDSAAANLQPALVIDAAFLAEQARKNDGQFANEIAKAELLEEYGNTFLRLTPNHNGIGDPYVAAIPMGWGSSLPGYLAIRYRNATPQTGEFFLGSGEGWTGQGDSLRTIWTTHGDWSLMVIDLAQAGLTSITDELINYCRLDFFANDCAEGESFDVEYIAFFHSAEAAERYDAILHTSPRWDLGDAKVVHHSFDQLYAGTGSADQGPANLFEPGHASEWDHTVVYEDHTVQTLTYWGWVAIQGQLGEFGYRIDHCEAVFDPSFAYETEAPVLNSAIQMGGDMGSRLKIAIPLDGLQGFHTVRTLYRSPDGHTVTLGEFTLQLPGNTADSILPEPPSHATFETLDMMTLAELPGFAKDWPEAGIPVPHVKLGYGSVLPLGYMDLSQYTSVRITYCCDGSEVTANAFNAASSLAIGLKKEATSYGQVTDDNMNGDLAHTDMVFLEQSWYAGARDAVVDLSNVRYKGDVWLTTHNPADTEIVILGVEFTRKPSASLPEADLLDVQVVDGQVKDLSDYGFTVTPSGAPAVGDSVEGTAMIFNRDGAYKVSDIGELYHVLADGFTMEIYFTTGDDVERYENLCANMQAGGFGFDYEDGVMNFCLKEANASGYTCVSAPIHANTTYHAVGVYDREQGQLTLYLNGQAIHTVSIGSQPVFATNSDLVIGGDTGEGENPEYLCDADVYFVRLYSSPLDDKTVQLLCDYR